MPRNLSPGWKEKLAGDIMQAPPPIAPSLA